ncbi:MAG: protein kinase [Candidatus Eisenbacteria bacterium]
MRSERVEEILDQLLDLPPEERGAELARLTAGDDALFREVASLLAAFEATPTFLAPVRPQERPNSIGRYTIGRELGRGAMGVVYLASDPDLGRTVAIKTLGGALSGSDPRRARLREEARMLAAVSQPNVAHLYTFEELPELSFLTMEYVPGMSLADRLRAGRMNLEEAIDCGRQIAAALEATHERGLIHRDLKPQNIRVTPEGWVKVLDFGLAATLGARGEACGTLGYMSPEQLAGEEPRTSADLWALGCVLFECLTGAPAIQGMDRRALADATTEARFEWALLPRDLAPTVLRGIEGCLSREATERPTATEMRRLLEEALLRLRATGLLQAEGAGGGDARPTLGNLPHRLSTFVGRTAILRQLESSLRAERLVTLTGAGGAGKTRTAVEAAHRVSAHFPGGAWMIDLSSLEAGARMVDAATRALGIKDAGGATDPLGSLAAALSSRRVLLLIDNCEHMIEEAATFARALLERCPELTFLATSREPLGVEGEQVIALPPLELPAPTASDALATEAVRLFVAKARARQPRYELAASEVETAAEICRRLDGLPLAIELAAAQTRALSLPEILLRVESSPLTLVGGRGGPERHQSLARVIDWSYLLLTPAEQRLLARLSVFRDGWSLRGAELVAGGDGLDRWEVCDCLGRLVERSLVEVRIPEDAGPARYRFLELVRSFARERLREDRAAQAETEARLLDFAETFLAECAPEDRSPLPEEMARIHVEYANLIGALELARQSGRIDRALQLAVPLGRWWLLAGYMREGLSWLRPLLDDRRRADPNGPNRLPRAEQDALAVQALNAVARMAGVLEDFATADPAVEEALTLARQLGRERLLLQALQAAGTAAWFSLRVSDARGHFAEALDLARRVDDRHARAIALANLAAVNSIEGRHTEALPLYEESVALAKQTGDRVADAKAQLNLGRTRLMLGQVEEGLLNMRASLERQRELGDPNGVADALHSLGSAEGDLDRLDEAQSHLIEAARIRYGLGRISSFASAGFSLARAWLRAGDTDRAAEFTAGLRRAVEEHGGRFFPELEANIGAFETQVRAALGDERWSATVARGRERGLAALAEWALGISDTTQSFGGGSFVQSQSGRRDSDRGSRGAS